MIKKSFFKKLWIRLSIGIKIIFNVYPHWAMFSITEENLVRLIKEEGEVDIQMHYHGLVKYNVYAISKLVAESRDEIDVLLDKAHYEAEALLHSKKHKK